ncbi:hypothetical protein Pla100_03580 [Neorhodopirellula pilleata]|uniref:Uncharacterized protein n=1 Tax=Neorhodopirellula pilleata TaxID=2714738 RepID=A0A5C6AVC7_9BACT|nr:hypothetical protein Pla100_03580 [Neorhodopirellula pilleata]
MVTYPHTPFHDKLFSLFQKVSRLMTFPLVHPGDWGEDWSTYPGILDDWPPTYECEEE